MRTRKFVASRTLIDANVDKYAPILKLVKGYAVLRNKVNDKMNQKGFANVSQDTIYRFFTKRNYPDEYICWIIIDACKEFCQEIKRVSAKIK